MFIGETTYTMRADVSDGTPQAAEVDYALTMPGSAASAVEVIAFGPGSSVSTLR